jgi:hypothetical protein
VVVISLGRPEARAAPAAPFSHQRHLAQPEVTCDTCHGSVHESTAAADDNRPGGEACLRCHEPTYAGLARAEPPPARAFRFNHKLHLGLGNLSPIFAAAIDGGAYLGDGAAVRPQLKDADRCAACHRGLALAGRVTSANMPRMADCLVCHSRIAPPVSCAFCHTPDAVLRPPSHTGAFTDRHSSPEIGKTDCKVCHGTRFTCMGCH